MTEKSYEELVLPTLLATTPDAVLVSDGDGIIQLSNAAAGKLFGYDPADFVGKSVNILMPRALAERHDGFIRRHLETGQKRVIGRGRIVEGQRRDGTTFPVHASVGQTTYLGAPVFVGVLHDLSKRANAEDALARSARLDAIGQMTVGIGHDFNNILTVVIGNLEMLRDRATAQIDHAMLDDALEAAKLGAVLTSDLNSFSRRSRTHFQVIDANAACRSAVSLIKRTFNARYDIVVELDETLPVVLADCTQLQAALINIALNARDAMPDGGTLFLGSDLVTIDDNYIAQELDVAQGTYVRISVTDTGMGMGPETQQRIFEPFFTTKPIGQGTGLGLAIVHGFVRQCDGHLTVYSEIGHGTTIALYFPTIDDAPTPPQNMRNLNIRRDTAGRTILVVEDNPQVRKLTSARIRELGYHVREADCGETAAEILRQVPDVDAVFTDLVLPGDIDGLKLARHIAQHYPELPVLLTSGYAEVILNHADEDIGHDILHKPYRQSDLSSALSSLFAKE